MISRYNIINVLIEQNKYEAYLEIGVRHPADNFDKIRAKFKVGVDPMPLRNDILGCTSDDYFAGLTADKTFDLVFIDGLHHCGQVLKDIENALNHLSGDGMIVCHDMIPECEDEQVVPKKINAWTGDCWKAWAHLRMTRPDLEMCVLNADHGLGIIIKGNQELFRIKKKMEDMDYDFFVKNKEDLMNIVELE